MKVRMLLVKANIILSFHCLSYRTVCCLFVERKLMVSPSVVPCERSNLKKTAAPVSEKGNVFRKCTLLTNPAPTLQLYTIKKIWYDILDYTLTEKIQQPVEQKFLTWIKHIYLTNRTPTAQWFIIYQSSQNVDLKNINEKKKGYI